MSFVLGDGSGGRIVPRLDAYRPTKDTSQSRRKRDTSVATPVLNVMVGPLMLMP